MANPIKPNFKTEFIPILLILLSIIASFYFYDHFPEKVPTHWNYKGQIDGWSGKTFAAFFSPGLNLIMYLLFLAFPYLDPKKDRYADFARVYHVFKGLLITVMTVIYFYIGLAGLGYELPVAVVIPAAIGVLFVVLGNYFGKIKPNWFMGIRTPWTLSNEEVWNKTHRLGGKLFMLMGFFMILGTILPPAIFWGFFIFGTVIVALIPAIYSFIIFKKLEKK